MIIDYGKLATLVIIVIGVFVLRGIGEIDDAGFYSIVGAIVGYITGNGRLASKGLQSKPMIGITNEQEGDTY